MASCYPAAENTIRNVRQETIMAKMVMLPHHLYTHNTNKVARNTVLYNNNNNKAAGNFEHN